MTLADIHSADWSLMLDSTAAAQGLATGLGSVVQGVDDVIQCLQIIFTTPKGSDPLRPAFAMDLHTYLDQPIDIVRPAIVRDIYAAVAAWEPRVTVHKVAAFIAPDQPGQLVVEVTWTLNIDLTGLPANLTQPMITAVTLGF